MKAIRWILRKTLRTLLWVVAFVAIYMIAAFVIPKIVVGPENENEPKDVSIYILSNGIHTDIVVPCKNEMFDWTKHIPFEHTKRKDSMAKYLAIGWGDKGFYLETPTWADLKASTAIKAAFGLSTTALHTTYYTDLTESDHCKTIVISRENYQKLIDHINSSFDKKNGKPVLVDSDVRYGQTDAFYEAKGSYSLFTTCNTWANNVLKNCGQKACLWTPFDKGIFDIYE